MGDFTGKVVVVTGAASGIGRSITLRYSELGAVVFIADIELEKGEALRDLIEQKGQKAFFVLTDVSNPTAIEAFSKSFIATISM